MTKELIMAVAYTFQTHYDIMKISAREAEVLYLIAYEFSNREIAKMLYISVNTVDTYRRKLFMKFGVCNAPGLIRRAFEEQIFPMEMPTFINGCPSELLSNQKTIPHLR